MHIILQTSTSEKVISEYRSSIVPRRDEYIRLVDASALFRVLNVYYQAQNTDQESNLVHLEVEPADQAARQYLSEILYRTV